MKWPDTFLLTERRALRTIVNLYWGRGVVWLTHQLVTLKTASSNLVDPVFIFDGFPPAIVYSILSSL